MKPVSIDDFGVLLSDLKKLLAGEAVEINGRQVRCVFAAGDKRFQFFLARVRRRL